MAKGKAGKGKDKGKGKGKSSSAKGKGAASSATTKGKGKGKGSSEPEPKWVQVKGTVLVTGAAGYIALNVIRRLLDRGYKVRGTVRSLTDESKVAALKQHFPTVELFEADLMGGPEAFEKAMQGCKFVHHCASPVVLSASDPQKDIVDPALKGTEAVMMAAVKTSVARVVLTSSVAAVGPPQDWWEKPNYELEKPLTPEDWNTTSTVERGPYRLSKRLAEEKAWEIAKANPSLSLVTICPSLVVGPMIGNRADGVSIGLMKGMLDGTSKADGLPPFVVGCVDVRDVSLAHVNAMELSEAAGKRFIIGSPEGFTLIELADKLRSKFSAYPLPTEGFRTEFRSKFDTSATKEMLKFKPRPIEITLFDMANAAIRNGIVQKKYKLKPATMMKIKDIKPDHKGINLLTRVVSVKDVVESKGGKKVQEVVLGDPTGTVAVLLIAEELEFAKADSMLELHNAAVRMNEGFIRLQVGKWGKIATVDDDPEFKVDASKDADVSRVEYELVGVAPAGSKK